jgi:hypothetical protein
MIGEDESDDDEMLDVGLGERVSQAVARSVVPVLSRGRLAERVCEEERALLGEIALEVRRVEGSGSLNRILRGEPENG